MSEFPEGWECTQLGFVTILNMGQSPKGAATNPHGDGLPLIGGAADYEGGQLAASRYTTEPTKVCQEGDLILCIRATIGKVATADGEYCLGRGVAGLTPVKVDHDYLRYYLVEQSEALDRAGTGTTFRQINKETLTNWLFPLPPLAEQHRIVAKLDALFARTRQAREALEHIPTLIEHYKQAILAAAFRGELTADWRSENGATADSWVMTSVGEVITDIHYGTSKKCGYEPKGTPVLRIPNVTENGIDTEVLKYTELTEKEIKKLSLIEGDLLVVRSNGSVDLVGRVALVDEGIVGFAYAGYLIRLRPDSDTISPQFLRWMLTAPQTRRTIEVNARSTSGVHNVNSQELQDLVIPHTSMAEQAEIVERIEDAMEWLDIVLDEATSALRLLDHLDQANLAKAFRGELVPQDPDDEPASVLLGRIRAARAEESGGRKRKKRKKN